MFANHVAMTSDTVRRYCHTLMIAIAGVLTASAPAQIIQFADLSSFNDPNETAALSYLTTDSVGNVYGAAEGINTVFRVNCDGVVSPIINSSGDGLGNPLLSPTGITVDAADNVFVVGFESNNAFKITPNGTISQIIDSNGAGDPNSLIGPLDVVADSAGNVYVSSLGTNRGFKVTPAGVITQVFDASGDGNGNTLESPDRLAIDSADNLYVACRDSANVFSVSPAGVTTEVFDLFVADPNADPNGPTLGDIAVDPSANLFVIYLGGSVYKVTPGGMASEIINASSAPGSGFSTPFGLAIDGAGNAFVTALFSNNAFRIEPDGTVTEIINASGDGTNPLLLPLGIAVNGSGLVYVSDFGTQSVFRIGAVGDADGDGVADPCDVCPGTPPGVPVDANGRARADLDDDCDVDMNDFNLFQQSFTGP